MKDWTRFIEQCEKKGEIIGLFTRSKHGNYFIDVPGVNTFATSAEDERNWDEILKAHGKLK